MSQYQITIDVNKFWADQDAAGQLAEMVQCDDETLASIWEGQACADCAYYLGDMTYSRNYSAVLLGAYETADGSAVRIYSVSVN